MKLLVVGANCSGKTTLARRLRAAGVTAVDLDDELVRLNGGVYPDIDTRRSVLAPQALENCSVMAEVILLHSTLEPDDVLRLKSAGFTTALLDVSEVELRRRHQVRSAAEGWTNEAWFDDNQASIELLRQHGLFDHVVDAERDLVAVAADLMRLHAACLVIDGEPGA